MRTGSIVFDDVRFLLHVHVIAACSPEVQVLRSFRDKLRADPALVAEYVAAKRAIIADGCTDGVDYSIRKGVFVTRVMDVSGEPRESALESQTGESMGDPRPA
jgi:GrpB-like predicted nucleotidyltransferase (UPF0157 family)